MIDNFSYDLLNQCFCEYNKNIKLNTFVHNNILMPIYNNFYKKIKPYFYLLFFLYFIIIDK